MISNLGLKDRCKEYILKTPESEAQDRLIENALITAYREISNFGSEPLEWNKESYDEVFTRYYASISAITAADPGIITADSVDPDLTSNHGFQSNDIVYLDGINGENNRHRLNGRFFRMTSVSDTTISLQTLNGNDDIDTTDYEVYDSGGTIYHAGIVIPKTSIEPTGGTADYEWDIKRVYDVTFDGLPCNPITEVPAQLISTPGGRPRRWRYKPYAYGTFADIEHLLFWYGFPGQRYNVSIHMEKEYPDLQTWTKAKYPPCPSYIHEMIWHRALSNLAMHAERQRRVTKDGGDNTKIEIANANYWISKAMEEKIEILEYSRKLSGGKPYMSEGMSA